MQLALVAGVAAVTAWLARRQSALQRFYLVGIGLIFLYLALDEYSKLHESIPHWGEVYLSLGIVMVAATAAVALRSPRSLWIWYLCLLTGLAMSAAGGVFLEVMPPMCGELGFLRFNGCLSFFVWEESLEFAGIWLALVAVLGALSEAVPMEHPQVSRFLIVLPALWILLLTALSNAARLELRLVAQPSAVQFESGVRLDGYRIDTGAQTAVVRLYASAKQVDYIGLGYSIHLVDQVSGGSLASRDDWADRNQSFWPFGPDYSPVFLQWMEVEIPPQAPVNRALWVVLSVWREEGGAFVTQEVTESDLQLLDDTQVVLGELVLPAVSADMSTAGLAKLDNGFVLAAVEMPEHAQAGETLRMSFTWRSDVDGQEDHVQFLHFGNVESGDWWVYDQLPLGDRLPTRLWYKGLADSEVWQVPLPADLAPGRYEVFTGLYRTRDLERVPASDMDGETWLDGRVSLGNLIIE